MRLDLTSEIIETFAKGVAHSDDNVQAAFINTLGEEFKISMRAEPFRIETQLCFISDKLDKSGAEFVKELAAFIQLREEVPT